MKTNELIWTKEKPTKAGWYWLRSVKAAWREVVEVRQHANGAIYSKLGLSVNKGAGVEWAGPIPEPREAEAAPAYEDPNPTMLHPKPMVCILKPDEFRERGEMYGQQGERGLYVQIVGTSKLKDGTPVYEVQI